LVSAVTACPATALEFDDVGEVLLAARGLLEGDQVVIAGKEDRCVDAGEFAGDRCGGTSSRARLVL